MTVHQILMKSGDWSVALSPGLPRDVLDSIGYFGHVAVLSGRIDPRQYGDTLLSAARYVGVVRTRNTDETSLKISGASTTIWLGDDDDKGAIIESAVDLQ